MLRSSSGRYPANVHFFLRNKSFGIRLRTIAIILTDYYRLISKNDETVNCAGWN